MNSRIGYRLVVLLVAVAWPALSTVSAAERKPSILFIITDQQFADAMSCRMGDQFIHTPTMDRLAQRGTLFTRAYSSNPLCMPWRNSVFTGRYPHETGVTQNAAPPSGLDPKEFICLGTYFRHAGYDAAYSGKWHLCFNVKAPAAHGFEIVTGQVKGNHDAGVTAGAVEFLARSHERPFLLVASFLNPHNICEWARRLAGREQVLNCGEIGAPPPLEQLPPMPANFAPPKNEPDGMTLMRRAYQVDDGPFPVGKFTVADWRKHRWGYYRMIEKVDAEIGKVLAALRQAGLEDNTLVIFTADHGECAGAHGFNQKTVLYDESARVPLIFACKGRTAGATTDKLVNTGIDLLPTMLEFAGLEVPRKLPGRSLLPLAFGQPVAAWRDCIVVENNMTQTGEVEGFRPTMEGRMVRSDRYKYCVFSRGRQRESLVDMQADPGETIDLATDLKYREVLLQHRELLTRFGKEHNDTLVKQLLADNVKPIDFAAEDAGSFSVAQRLTNNPIIRPDMLPGKDGANINGPSLIRAPSWLTNRLGAYYLYFAHHGGKYVRLAYADRLEGPWKVYEPGTLQLKEAPGCAGHIASPDVHADDARREIRMYFHGPAKGGSGQKSFVAVSKDGLHFKASDEVLGQFYFRVFQWQNAWFAMAKGGLLYRSNDGLTGFAKGKNPLPGGDARDENANMPGPRHVALHRMGNELLVYYSNIGDEPERILRRRIQLTGDWKTWTASAPEEMLRPETDYEGANLPLKKSASGAMKGRENALRDPGIFVDADGRVYLLYSVAGESGIGISELTSRR